MTRRLASIDSIVERQVKVAVAEAMAEDIIGGRVIHNVETDMLIARDKASDDDVREAVAAYQRFLLAGDQ